MYLHSQTNMDFSIREEEISIPPPAYTPHDVSNNTYNTPIDHDDLSLPPLYRNQSTPVHEDDPWRSSNQNRLLEPDNHSSLTVESQLECYEILACLVHFIEALIIFVMSIPSFKVYGNYLNQIQGGNLGYGLGGSIISFIMAIISLFLLRLCGFETNWGFIFKASQITIYGLGGGLLGYGTYVSRDDQVCSTSSGELGCYPIHYAGGWRCGIVVTAMCGVIVLQAILLFLMRVVAVIKVRRMRRRSRGDTNV